MGTKPTELDVEAAVRAINGEPRQALSQAERSARLRERRLLKGVPDERAVYRSVAHAVARAALRAATSGDGETAWLKAVVRSAARTLTSAGFDPKASKARIRSVLDTLAVGRTGKGG